MIPKKIHYCWFGRGQKSKLALKCIESWHKFLPDYEFKEWNEDNFDIASNEYVKEAYDAHKLAFVADYVRLHALATEGGIYMDTDVEVLRDLSPFLHHLAFTGYESPIGGRCITGTMGSIPGGRWVSDLLAEYVDRHFLLADGSLNQTTNVEYTRKYMQGLGVDLDGKFQDVPGLVTLYPVDYFCVKNTVTRKIEITENSYTIHHFSGSWHPWRVKMRKRIVRHFGDWAGMWFSLFTHNPVYIVRRVIRYRRTGH